ncbi:hypothetical protein [Bradyrhizobium diazoefficiens]|uniref:hypothetical protein n=1 Tax=Bradyrhizobium diazoefficiens TaxID=1355477 RepID=UPI001B6549CA|nr:hypothetical protein [Bradyrhizobium japonicum]
MIGFDLKQNKPLCCDASICIYNRGEDSSVLKSLVFWVLPTAAWLFTGLSCDFDLAMEMHMKMFVEVSLNLDVALQGQSVTQITLANGFS